MDIIELIIPYIEYWPNVFLGMSAGARIYEYINLKPNIPTEGGKIIPFHILIGDVGFHNVK